MGVFSTIVVLAASLATAFAAPVGRTVQPLGWVNDLENKGFTVQEGVYDFFSVKTCAGSDTCYAINPLTPYGLMYLPPHPNETSAGGYSNTCHRHKQCKTLPDGQVLAPNWRLAEGETVVLVGNTPPKAQYWSFSNYLYTRFHPKGWTSNASAMHRIVACKDGPSRCEVFAGINDPLNYLTVNSTSGSPFNQTVAIVLASDAKGEAAVTGSLAAAPVGPVNTLRYPGGILNLGVTSGLEDELMNVLRVEGVQDPLASDAFYSKAPFKVYRVSPPHGFPVAPQDRFPSFEGRMRNRYTGVGEHAPKATFEQLQAGLKQLTDKVQKQHGKGLLPGWDFAVVPFQSFVKDSGYECLRDGSQCQGDCRDTIYAKGTLLIQEGLCNRTHLPCKAARRATLTEGQDDALYVVGVNHKLTSQAVYASVTVYDYPKLASGTLRNASGALQDTEMEAARDLLGSANKYFPEGHPIAPYLYVVKFARKCLRDDFDLCYEVLSESADPSVLTIALDSPVFFLERTYIHPGTKSGPAVNETILPTLLHHRSK